VQGNIRIAASAADLAGFLQETVTRSDFKLRKIKLAEQSNWSIKNGVLSHFSTGFFHVAGIRSRISREEHLMLFQPQSALTGLSIYRDGRDVYVLLQARVEPGLVNVGQYGPTIQSTAANYTRMHGGKETTYAELFRSFSPLANPLGNNKQFDLGKRYFQKNKVLSYVELDKQVETKENMIWAPLTVVAEVQQYDNFLNPDLRSLLACFDWDLYINDDDSSQGDGAAAGDDAFALPANRLGNNEWELVPVNQLSGWEFQEYGVADVSDSGIWVDMFHVSCKNREVQEWSQPLLSCANEGLAVMLVRVVNGRYEFLVSIESEFGISGQQTVLPTYVIYPGDSHRNMRQMCASGTLMAEMKQSEEGGRFYLNESVYQMILVTPDFEIESHQRWVSAERLKSILKTSCQASIQLRCMGSLVLDLINPGSFKLCRPRS